MDVSAVAPFSNVECPTCSAANRVKTDFGQYKLVRRLAEGGMSLVFVAVDNTLGREVALKILNEDYSADERRIAAFEEEARITASFTHPNVVRVFTTGRAFGRFFIAMELVPGGHFEHQIRERGKIPEIEILPFAVQVAEGLEAARAAGLIHRDIKPGNILLDSSNNAKIVDFGLALVTKGGLATAQEIWATPYYVPPETIEGHEEDFRSDLYAFGATLYHALAGKPSCDEQSMATDVLRQAKKHVKALRSAAPDVSDDTCAIVDKAMAYDRNARFSSYGEMISQLKTAQARLKRGGGSITSAATTKRRASIRNGERLAIGAAAVVLLSAIGGGLFWILREEPAKKSEPMAIMQIPEIQEDGGAATLIGQRYREARQAVEAGEYEKARKSFAGLRDDDGVQEPTRTWAAVEAVLVTFLDGRTLEAKKEAKAAAEHIQAADLPHEKMGERLLSILGRLDELEPVKRRSPETTGDDATWGLAMMLGGVKNWEQGLTMAAAADFFEPVTGAHFKGKDQWVKAYQKIAAAYLEDARILSDPVFATIPQDKAACKAAIARLDVLLKEVKTHGRAKFNIRAFQLDLARQAKLLDGTAATSPRSPETGEIVLKPGSSPDAGSVLFPLDGKPPAPGIPEPAMSEAKKPADPLVPTAAAGGPAIAPGEDVLPKFQSLAKGCRFEEAANFLKSLTGNPPGANRDSLLVINNSAQGFLHLLEQDLASSTAPAHLRTRQGDAFSNVKVTESGRLKGTAGGETKEYSWGEIDPESVILLYRTNARNRTADVDQLQRHECAIAYDWLVGDRARAVAAADRLGLDSPIFRRRWETLAAGLPK